MSRPKIPWERLRDAYEKGADPCALAQQYGVSCSTVRRHIRAEGWTASCKPHAITFTKGDPSRPPAGKKPPEQSVLPQLHQAARRLQEAAAALLAAAEGGDEVSIRDVQDLAALLRELTNLALSLDESGPGLVRVVLEPPLEDWAM